MDNIIYLVTELGKFTGAFTQAGFDLYYASLGTPMEFTEWRFDDNLPYQKVCEGYLKNDKRKTTTPVMRVVKVIVDGYVF